MNRTEEAVRNPQPNPRKQRRRRERGFVLITMTASSIALLVALGLAVDVGRMFIAKSETQAFVDAAALAATLELDGTSSGIAAAKAAVAAQTNKWNFNTTAIPAPTVTFATSLAGPWSSNPASGVGILYAKVNATVPVSLFFMPVVASQFTTNVNSIGTGGQVPLTTFPQGLAPYTAVSTDTTPPNFGLVVGKEYDIQWPAFNGTRAGCGPASPDKCFVQPACNDESFASKAAVVSNWSASNNGYWGSNANSEIRDEILDVIQIQPVSIGTNIQPILTNGDKAAEAVYLDQRANEDNNVTTNDLDDYFADSTHNNRRMLPVPIVDPTSPTNTTVIGFGLFLLEVNGGTTSNFYKKGSNGNDPYCAIYAGPYDISGRVGGGGSTGATVVHLVQ